MGKRELVQLLMSDAVTESHDMSGILKEVRSHVVK